MIHIWAELKYLKISVHFFESLKKGLLYVIAVNIVVVNIVVVCCCCCLLLLVADNVVVVVVY